MRLLALLAVTMLAGTLVTADDKKKDEEAILGKWQIEKFDAGDASKNPPADALAKMSMTFKKDGKLMTMTPNGTEDEADYKLDPSAKVKTIDVTPIFDKKPAEKNPGIYELNGDTLTICLANGGKASRPTEFKADAKTGVMVITLKRAKDK